MMIRLSPHARMMRFRLVTMNDHYLADHVVDSVLQLSDVLLFSFTHGKGL
jgi:hypothetical protein